MRIRRAGRGERDRGFANEESAARALGVHDVLAAPRRRTAAGDWPNYGRTPGGDRHSPLAQIDRANVGKLALAWEYKTGEAGIETGNPTALEATPLIIDGVMYLSTPLGKVIALDPVNGELKMGCATSVWNAIAVR